MSVHLSIDTRDSLSSPTSPSRNSRDSGNFGQTSSVCFKGFIITTVVLGMITMIASGLAILSYHGVLSGTNSVGHLLKIGEVNSYLMLAAGIALFAIASVAWGCHLAKERTTSVSQEL